MPNSRTPKRTKRSTSKNRSQKQQLYFKKLALTFIILGSIFLIIPSIFYLNQTIQLQFFTPHPVSSTVHQLAPKPTRIKIPQIKLDLPIEETVIQGNTWGIAQNAISHLGSSSRPGEKGVIVMYGHNTNNRFGPIRWLKKNQLIVVTTVDNKDHSFIVREVMEVPANKMDIFGETDETLILYTCSGFADTKRFVVIAKPVDKP